MLSSRKEYFEPISEPMFPQASASYWTVFLWLATGGFVAATPIVLTATWPIGKDLLAGYAVAAFWIVPICLIFARTQSSYLKRKMGRVDFDGETVTVYDDIGIPVYETELAECRWFSGNRSWATVPYGSNWSASCGFKKVFLIEFPSRFRTPERSCGKNTSYAEGPVIAAVGLTEETRRYWEDVFYRTGLGRNEKRETQPAPFSETCLIMLAIFMIPGSFFLTMFIAGFVDSHLLEAGVSRDIATGISFPLFMPGTLFLILVLAFVPMFSRRNVEVRRIIRPMGYRLGIWWSVGVFTAISLFGFLSSDVEQHAGWTMRTKIAGTLTTSCMAAATTVFLFRSLREPEKSFHETSD